MKKKPEHSTRKELDDVRIPELTAKDFAEMRPASEVLPAIVCEKAAAELLKTRGRPKADQPKKSVSIRLDSEIIAFFKAGGRGWQSRIDAALKEWVKEHKAA
ncbi:BrnA antitoxin family protein [Geomobilimonas luticola]|uniref:BrnA antitoxin family protein n=1 Tax=Geomobilimonas luticola TaxID=1114878 RepID=A0ABS5S7S2_9BACT|nr:BrnA antitoxin family protein [Geomobilimonas luticola]MBT0651426.1 BrnA antitoxin family protein [Geomobilimonas luticola]